MPDPIITNLEPTSTETSTVTDPQPGNLEPGDHQWYTNEAFGIPPELQQSPFITRQPDLQTALKSLDHQGRTLSNKLTTKPTDESTPEEWNKFYNELGRPEKKEDYDATIMVSGEDGEPVKMEWNEAQKQVVDRLSALAHNSGLSQRQFNSIFKEVLKEEQEFYALHNSPESAEKTLKELWGKGYAENISKAASGWNSLPKALQQSLMPLPLATRHEVSAYIAGLSQETTITTGVGAPTGPRTLEAINQEIYDLQSGKHKDYGNALDDRTNLTRHKSANTHFKKLIEERGRLK